MNSDPHEDPPEWCLTDDMRVLFNECIVKLQRGDPPGSWDVVVFRISELRDRLERAYSDVAGPAAERTHLRRACYPRSVQVAPGRV